MAGRICLSSRRWASYGESKILLLAVYCSPIPGRRTGGWSSEGRKYNSVFALPFRSVVLRELDRAPRVNSTAQAQVLPFPPHPSFLSQPLFDECVSLIEERTTNDGTLFEIFNDGCYVVCADIISTRARMLDNKEPLTSVRDDDVILAFAVVREEDWGMQCSVGPAVENMI